MRRTASLAALAAALLLVSLANALPHDDHAGMDMNMDQGHGHGDAPAEAPKDTGDPADLSYFAYGEHSGMILAHIILMVLSWCFILPVGRLL